METSVENVFASKSKGTEDAFVARNGYCNCKSCEWLWTLIFGVSSLHQT